MTLRLSPGRPWGGREFRVGARHRPGALPWGTRSCTPQCVHQAGCLLLARKLPESREPALCPVCQGKGPETDPGPRTARVKSDYDSPCGQLWVPSLSRPARSHTRDTPTRPSATCFDKHNRLCVVSTSEVAECEPFLPSLPELTGPSLSRQPVLGDACPDSVWEARGHVCLASLSWSRVRHPPCPLPMTHLARAALILKASRLGARGHREACPSRERLPTSPVSTLCFFPLSFPFSLSDPR